MGRKVTHKEFMKKFKEKGKPNIEVIGKYVNSRTPILCRCKKNKQHIWEIIPANLTKSKQPYRCPYCHGTKVNESNCVSTLRPDLTQFFKDKKKAHEITLHSNNFVDLICPICGSKISFPNRFLHELLIQLKKLNELKKYEFEYSPDWAKPYRYDGYMLLNNNIEILIEVQGSHHYDYGIYKDFSVKERDENKLKKANDQNIKLIYIEVLKSNFDYLKENFINSELNDFIDFQKIDWNEIYYNIQIGELKRFCDEYNKYDFTSVIELAKRLKTDYGRLTQKLKRGKELGLCDYKECATPIKIIYKDDNIIEAKSLSEASRITGQSRSAITNCLYGKVKKNRKGYNFEYLNKNV